jgi:4-hydroxybenzoate polyprenyltransferase
VIVPLLQAMRPKQWTKNLLVFAGVVFAQLANQPEMLLRAFGGFVAFSLLASMVYLINDLKDVEADRQHPKKRKRPIASGRLTPGMAWTGVPVLLGLSAAISVWLGPAFGVVLLIYLLSNSAYSFGLKHQVILDIFLIASGFVLRAVAGVELLRPVAPDVQLSSWLLVCTFFGALFLAASKRRRELQNAGTAAVSQREVLGTYTPELLDRMLTVCASATLMSYALYTIWPATVAKFGSEMLIVTVPVVAYGVFRYLHLVRVSETSEDPSYVLLSDRPIQATVALFVALAVAIVYLGR